MKTVPLKLVTIVAEPVLEDRIVAALHELDGDGRVSRRSRERFGLFRLALHASHLALQQQGRAQERAPLWNDV